MGNHGLNDAAPQPLAPSDYAMVMAKSRENRLAFATWLMFFRNHGRFPRGPPDLESLDVAALARQIEVTVPADGGLFLAERTAKRLRTEIRSRFGFREATVADAQSPVDRSAARSARRLQRSAPGRLNLLQNESRNL